MEMATIYYGLSDDVVNVCEADRGVDFFSQNSK